MRFRRIRYVLAIARLPGVLEEVVRLDTLTAPVDLFPTLCSLCNVPVPALVEGHDLSVSWCGRQGAVEQEAVLTMNFSSEYDRLENGLEWRGVRTKEFSYAKWLDGREELYHLKHDPLQLANLIGNPDHDALCDRARQLLARLQIERGDKLQPCMEYADWYDTQRRVVKNAFGDLGDPEDAPDWTLFAAEHDTSADADKPRRGA